MNKVYACIDGLAQSEAVIDWAVWSSLRLAAPLELLHVLQRTDSALTVDYSGSIGLGAQEALLVELSTLDAQRGQLAQQAGRQLLADAQLRAAEAGVAALGVRLRHGELLDSVLALEPEARLFVLGQHAPERSTGVLSPAHSVERVIRAVKCPVLVATAAPFKAPKRVVIAFDTSPTARKTLDTVVRSPLLRGLAVTVAMAGTDTPEARQQLEDARLALVAAGFDADAQLLSGEPEDALPALIKAQGASLLVMGAYGHSRIRQLVIGSTTTALLRLSGVPVLILR